MLLLLPHVRDDPQYSRVHHPAERRAHREEKGSESAGWAKRKAYGGSPSASPHDYLIV